MFRELRTVNTNMVAPILVDTHIAKKFNTGEDLYEEKSLMSRIDMWHKIDVKNGGHYDNQNILRSIIKAVYPADLIPVMYQRAGEDCSFIVRNCQRALEQLCKANLTVYDDNEQPLSLTITLGFACSRTIKINIQAILGTALKKRHDLKKKSMVLDRFHCDPAVYNIIYCPLSQQKTFTHVMKLLKGTSASFENMSLKHNELTDLTALENVSLGKVKYLDLRFNELVKADLLYPLKAMQIRELLLDGNPLCENYSSPRQYIESIRQFCPELLKLDGKYVGSIDLPLSYSIYTKGWKAKNLVSQFISHFFTLYDLRDKDILRGLYAPDAWFSTTVSTLKLPRSEKYLEAFVSENRNLPTLTNICQHLYHGEDEIVEVLKKFPQTRHNQNSFSYDLMYECDTYIMVSIEGLFKLISPNSEIYTFSRTFILSIEDDSEYKIMNDLYHVCAPLQTVHSFAYDQLESARMPAEIKLSCFSTQEREDMLAEFGELTTMNTVFCEKFLDDSDWDMRKALQEFLACYKRQTVPFEAFVKPI